MTAIAHNPILPGFHPDPSIVRAGDDYYIATSTFEWFPGVMIYHSRDLVRWELCARPLDRPSLLDMRGDPDSCGVWAPCLSHRDGLFYLAYTDAKRFDGDFKDTHNYVTTAPRVTGPWSERVYLHSRGFDPSLFHDDDGRSWLVAMVWDHRPATTRFPKDPRRYFGGVVLQEYDIHERRLAGKATMIFPGSSKGLTEGPHLYKRDGWYYLLVAEGGTGLGHAALFARSRDVAGPYEPDPNGHLLTSTDHPLVPLKRAGHASIVDTPARETFLVHLCSRPLPYRGRSVLGRETALQKVAWNAEGWPRLADGDIAPRATVATGMQGPAEPRPGINEHHTFENGEIPAVFQSLRVGTSEDWVSLRERPGWLCLRGRESLGSLFEQSLVARRQQAFVYRASTAVEFHPEWFQQMAGLVCYYSGRKYLYLHITHDEVRGRVLDLACCANSLHCDYPLESPIPLPENGPVALTVEVDHDRARFLMDAGDGLIALPVLDYSVLSDEAGTGNADANFTGAFVGLCCQDLTGARRPAYFDFFTYDELATAPF